MSKPENKLNTRLLRRWDMLKAALSLQEEKTLATLATEAQAEEKSPSLDLENKRFLEDPVGYCRKVTINPQTGSMMGTEVFDSYKQYGTVYVDLPRWGTSPQVLFDVRSTPHRRGAELITGYYVPYIAFGQITSNQTKMQLLEVPRTNPAHYFIFTGGQNGCSLLLCEKKGDKGTFLAVHYPNSDGHAKGYPLLKDTIAGTVRCDLRFDMYGIEMEPNAFSFFYYLDGAWCGVTQRQNYKPPNLKNMKEKRPEMSLRKTKEYPDPVQVTRLT